MDDYIIVEGYANIFLIVRTSDWVVVAECSGLTFAQLVATALNA